MNEGGQKRPSQAPSAFDGKKARTGGSVAASKPRAFSVSVAVPGSIASHPSRELRTFLSGQVARACVIYCVDEIIVYDDKNGGMKPVVLSNVLRWMLGSLIAACPHVLLQPEKPNGTHPSSWHE